MKFGSFTWVVFILLILPVHSMNILAKEKESKLPNPKDAKGKANRTRTVEFDDELVEGMGKKSYDSVTQIGKTNEKAPRELYHKKPNFNRELKQAVHELEYFQ